MVKQKRDPTKTEIGNTGEKVVTEYLVTQGWQILEHQWRCRWGEIDIVAQQGFWIIFVEVKTRQKQNWDEQGRLAVSLIKQRKLSRAAQVYLTRLEQSEDYTYRFDVALVEHSGSDYKVLEYLPAAFDVFTEE